METLGEFEKGQKKWDQTPDQVDVMEPLGSQSSKTKTWKSLVEQTLQYVNVGDCQSYYRCTGEREKEKESKGQV